MEEKSPDAHAPKIADPTSTDSLSRGSTQGNPVKKNISLVPTSIGSVCHPLVILLSLQILIIKQCYT